MSRTAAAESRSQLQWTKSVGFAVRPQEYEELLRAAEDAGMPIGEWIRDVSLRAAKGEGDNTAKLASLSAMVRISLEELAALRAVVLTLFGTTNPSLGKEEIDQVVTFAGPGSLPLDNPYANYTGGNPYPYNFNRQNPVFPTLSGSASRL